MRATACLKWVVFGPKYGADCVTRAIPDPKYSTECVLRHALNGPFWVLAARKSLIYMCQPSELRIGEQVWILNPACFLGSPSDP